MAPQEIAGVARRKKRRERSVRGRRAPKKQLFTHAQWLAVLGLNGIALLVFLGLPMGLGHWLFHPKLIIDLPPCPVGADKINFAKSLMTEQGPVFFARGHCLDQFTADPERFEQAVAVQREALDALPRVQVKCPIFGNRVDTSVFVEYEGRKIYFCSKDCPTKFQEEPSKFRGKLAASYCYQTKCPVADQDIDPGIFATMSGGETIYFCAEECRKTFLESPRKYGSNLIKQGYRIDL